MSLYSVEANKISVYYPLLLVLTILAKVYSWIALLSGSLKTKWRIDIRVDLSLIFQMNFYIISIGYVHCIIIYLITPLLMSLLYNNTKTKICQVFTLQTCCKIQHVSVLWGYLRLKYLPHLQTFQTNTYMLYRVNSYYCSTNGKNFLFLMLKVKHYSLLSVLCSRSKLSYLCNRNQQNLISSLKLSDLCASSSSY